MYKCLLVTIACATLIGLPHHIFLVNTAILLLQENQYTAYKQKVHPYSGETLKYVHLICKNQNLLYLHFGLLNPDMTKLLISNAKLPAVIPWVKNLLKKKEANITIMQGKTWSKTYIRLKITQIVIYICQRHISLPVARKKIIHLSWNVIKYNNNYQQNFSFCDDSQATVQIAKNIKLGLTATSSSQFQNFKYLTSEVEPRYPE